MILGGMILLMLVVKSAFKKGYKKYFYVTLKKGERNMRVLFFAILKLFYRRFNPFRMLGIAHGIQSVKGEEVISPSQIKRVFPKTIEASSHSRFYDLEVEAVGGSVAVVRDGFSTSKAASLTSSGRLIPEYTQQFTMKGIEGHKLFTFQFGRCFPKISHFDGVVATLTADCHHNYYHWLFDVLPKLYLLQKAKIKPDKYYLDTSKPFQKESLAMLGIEEDQIISCQDHPIISASSLALSSYPCLYEQPHWVIDFVRKQFLPEKTPTFSPKIYISRKDAPCRRVVNEEEVTLFLQKEGFEVVQTEHLNFAEQIALFHQAEVVVAPHGAGLSNLVFCNKDAKVLQFFSPRNPCICFWTLSNLLSLEYAYFRGEEDSSTYSPTEPGEDDMLIDLGKLKASLKFIQ